MVDKDTVVIYHANCLDGYGAAYAAWRKFKDSAEYVPANYGDNPPCVLGKKVYILDFSYKREVLLRMKDEAASILVLDHHKTAKEDLEGLEFAVFDVERSGCIMAWDYFHGEKSRPFGLELIQDRDLWRFNYRITKAFTAALRALIPLDFSSWSVLLNVSAAYELADRGKDLLTVFESDVEELAKHFHAIELFSVKGVACNAPSKYASELGNLLALQHGTYAAVYSYDGASKLWLYSLRSVGDFDVSGIAKLYGGGGHKNAAGFSSPLLIGAPDGK
jgi:nanoRNase/pAp phosphatase (c-di-AMP/oligoRNAs hydrolase)